MTELAIYILCTAGMVIASYLLGHVAATAGGGEDNNGFEYAFRRLSLGILLLVTLYAVVRCAGATVMAAVPALLLFGIRLRRIRWSAVKVSPAAAVLFCGVFALVAALKYFAGCDLHGNLYSLHYDHSFFTALANYVDRSGIESTNIELMYPSLQSPTIYHWFDVHFDALAGHLTGNYFNGRLLVALPVSAGVAVLGLAAVIGKYCGGGRKTPWLACLVFLLPVILVNLTGTGYVFGIIPFHNIIPGKIYVMMCVVTWTMLSKDKTLPLVVGGVLVSSAAPALFTGAMIALAWGFGAGRRNREYWKSVAALAVGMLWCAAFYTLTAGENALFTHDMSIPQQIGRAFTDLELATAGQYARVFAVRIALTITPCILLFRLLGRDGRKVAAALARENAALLLALVTGFVFACSLWFIRDAAQFSTEVSIPLAFVAQTALLAMLFTSRGVIRKVAAAAVAAAGVAVTGIYGGAFRGAPIDGDFTRKVAAAEGPVVWVDTWQRRETGSELVRDANYIAPFSAVRRLRNDYFPIRMDVYDIVYDSGDMRDYAVLASIENSTFYRWVESHGIPMKKLREAQTKFIKDNNIHYVIAPDDEGWIYGRGFRIEEKTALKSRGYVLFKISYDDNPVQ